MLYASSSSRLRLRAENFRGEKGYIYAVDIPLAGENIVTVIGGLPTVILMTNARVKQGNVNVETPTYDIVSGCGAYLGGGKWLYGRILADNSWKLYLWNGTTLTDLSPGISSTPYTIAFYNGLAYIGQKDGYFHKYDPNANTFTGINLGLTTGDHISAICGDDLFIYIGTVTGKLKRYDPATGTADDLTTNINAAKINQLIHNPYNNTIIAILNDGSVLKDSSNRGIDWTARTANLPSDFPPITSATVDPSSGRITMGNSQGKLIEIPPDFSSYIDITNDFALPQEPVKCLLITPGKIYIDTWISKTPLPPTDGRADLSTCLINGKLYCFGGWSMSEWLQGWNYRKKHDMHNFPTGAPYKYPMRFKVHYGSGVDSGEDVYLNGKCRGDFSDVRFTKKDGKTLLNYWLEKKVDNDYAIFWVEVETAHPKVETGNWSIDGNTYRYRTKITVTENSGTDLTDYPIRIEINGKYLVKMGYATENGNEIRFTDSDGVLLDFFRNSIFNSENATFWVKIPSLGANQTITIYMYYDANLTSVPKADKPENFDMWHWRKHQLDSGYACNVTFSKTLHSPMGEVVRIDSDYSSVGEGFIFKVFPKSFLHGKRVRVTWNGCLIYSEQSREIGWVCIIDGVLDRSSKLAVGTVRNQFPKIQLFSYITWAGWYTWTGWRQPTSGVLDLSSFTSEYVTLVIGMNDAWSQYWVTLDVASVQILDEDYNEIAYYEFPGSILADSSGEFEDGGIIRPYVSPEPSCTVELESELDENNNTSIYVYYGKSDASREDNPQEVDIFQLREHQTDPDYIPGFLFSGGAINIDSYTELDVDSVGEGFAFIVVPKSFLHGKRLQVSWNLYTTGALITPLHVAVLDAELHRMDTLPVQSIFETFTNIDAIIYPPPHTYDKWIGDYLQSSDILDLSSFTSDYVTIVICLIDDTDFQFSL